MRRETRETPIPKGFLRPIRRSSPGQPPFEEADEEQGRSVDYPNHAHVDRVERARRDEEFQREEDEKREDVERRRVCKNGIALDAFKSEHRTTELDLGSFECDNLGEGIGEHRDQDGQEQRVAQEGECDHERRSQDDVELDRLLDPRPVETEPDPEQPLADGGPSRWRRTAPVAGDQPLQREQEAGETPHRKERQQYKVFHQRMQRDEDDIVRHEVERDSGQQDRCRDTEYVQGVATTTGGTC